MKLALLSMQEQDAVSDGKPYDDDIWQAFTAQCDSYDDIVSMNQDMDRAVDEGRAVLEGYQLMLQALEDHNPRIGLTKSDLKTILFCAESMYCGLGYKTPAHFKRFAAEGLARETTATQNLQLAQEGLGEWIEKIFDSIVGAIKKIVEWVGKAMSGLFSDGNIHVTVAVENTARKVDEVNKQLPDVGDDSGEDLLLNALAKAVNDIYDKPQSTDDEKPKPEEKQETPAPETQSTDDEKPKPEEKQETPAPEKQNDGEKAEAEETHDGETLADLVRYTLKQLHISRHKFLQFPGQDLKDPHNATNKLLEQLALVRKTYGDSIADAGSAKAAQSFEELIQGLAALEDANKFNDMVKASDDLARSFAQNCMPSSLKESEKTGGDGQTILYGKVSLGHRRLVITVPDEKQGKGDPSQAIKHYSSDLVSVKEEGGSEGFLPQLAVDDAKAMLVTIRQYAKDIDALNVDMMVKHVSAVENGMKNLVSASKKSDKAGQAAAKFLKSKSIYILHSVAVLKKLFIQYFLHAKAYLVKITRQVQAWLVICANARVNARKILEQMNAQAQTTEAKSKS
jgi:hypothetical protein